MVALGGLACTDFHGDVAFGGHAEGLEDFHEGFGRYFGGEIDLGLFGCGLCHADGKGQAEGEDSQCFAYHCGKVFIMQSWGISRKYQLRKFRYFDTIIRIMGY